MCYDHAASMRGRPVLPVVYWLRAGAAAAALGLSLAGASIAAADDGGSTASAQTSGAVQASDDAQSPVGRQRAGRLVAGKEVGAASRAGQGAAAPAQQSSARGTDRPAPAFSRTPSVPLSTGGGLDASAQRNVRPVAAVSVRLRGLEGSDATVRAEIRAASMAAPSAVAAPSHVPLVGSLLGGLNTLVERWFDQQLNWLSGFPDSAVVDLMSGALLLTRKSLFNQLPSVSPLQTNSLVQSAQDGVIEGSLEVIDIEGDPYQINLVQGPEKGTVNVSVDGSYVYTTASGEVISPDFSDQFTVQITPAVRTFNLLDPFGDGSREVTVFVGADSYKNPFETPVATARFDTIDSAAILPDVPVSVTLTKGWFGQVNATVSLAGLAPDIDLEWMDARGNTGNVSLADLTTTYWDRFATTAANGGAGVTLALDFVSAEGVAETVILSDVRPMPVPAMGQYQFSGTLSGDPQGTVLLNEWDVVGTGYKAQYEAFLNEYVDVPGFQTVTLDLSKADFILDSYSPASYRSASYGAEQGMSYEEAMGTTATTTPTDAAANGTGQSLFASSVPAVPTYNRAVTVAGWSNDAVTVMMPQALGDMNALLIGDGIGRVRFGGLTPGWNTLQGPGWAGAVTTAIPYSDGFVLGLRTGAVAQWTGKGFKELQGTGWGKPVTAMMPYQSGFIVGLENGSIQQWTGTGWRELQNDGWSASVNTLTPYGNGFVVGLGSGAVAQWNGTGFTQLQGTGWQSAVTVTMPYQSGFVVGLKNGSIQQWTGTGWRQLQGTGWQSSANTLTPYGNGFVVGLGSGAVAQWNGTGFTQLHDTGWSGVTVSAPYKSGFVLGLEDGSIQQWTGTAWTELHGNWGTATTGLVPLGGDKFSVSQNNGAVQLWDGTQWTDLDASRVALSEETLQQAVDYAKNGGQAMGAGDPLFGQLQFQPLCVQSNSCSETGFYKFEISRQTNLAKKEFALGSGGQNVTLAYDVGTVTYGYAYVPDGAWNRLKPSQYSFAAMLALPTGPSISLNLAGKEGGLTWGPKTLFSGTLFYAPTMVGTFGVSAGVEASLNVQLGLPEGFTKDKLSAYAYYTPGFLIALNTGGNYGVETGFNDYPDINFSDFANLTSLTVSPTITPYLQGEWGLFAPKVPVLGDLTLFKLSIGYANPLSLNATVSTTAPLTVTLKSEGKLTYGAEVIPRITSALTYKDAYTIYTTEGTIWP